MLWRPPHKLGISKPAAHANPADLLEFLDEQIRSTHESVRIGILTLLKSMINAEGKYSRQSQNGPSYQQVDKEPTVPKSCAS